MSEKQVFQTHSPRRWRVFQWSTRLFLFGLLLVIPIVWIAMTRGYKPNMPQLTNDEFSTKKLNNPESPHAFSASDNKKYKGFNSFMDAKNAVKNAQRLPKAQSIRAGFYVNWDAQSLFSLESNIDKMNMVIPEWLSIDPKTDTLVINIDEDALVVLRQHKIAVLPILNNVNDTKDGDFDPKLLSRVLKSPTKSRRLIDDLIKVLKKYNFQGVNIDFEAVDDAQTAVALENFQREVYKRLHTEGGYLVTQDVMASNENFNNKKLAEYNDYIFLMAYDQHWTTSTAGPVCEQRWIEKMLDQNAKDIPEQKIVLCIAGYGYDWADGEVGVTVTYQEALATANEMQAVIDFDDDTYNCKYTYKDGRGTHHEVQFCDAATNFNTMRFADEYGVAGVALWRLGSEDHRIWSFYDRNLSNETLQKTPFDFSILRNIKSNFEKPNYTGDGEILDVVSQPQNGDIRIDVDTVERAIQEEVYNTLPTKYVIKKYGKVHNQVILTFDDGPDPDYTPKILDILKQEQVPAAFFVVGVMAEANLPILKRILKEGHEIGNHTFTHPNIAKVGRKRAYAEIEATRLLLESVLGRSTVLFRAPFNADSEPTKMEELVPLGIGKELNYYSIGESIDPEDWEEGVSADSIYARTIRAYEANPSKGIILFHDSGGNRQATVEALPRIIHYFKAKGVQFSTIANLLGKTPEEVMPTVQSSLFAANSWIAEGAFWASNLLLGLFIVALILGILRILAIAVMATIQYAKRKNEQAELDKAALLLANSKEKSPPSRLSRDVPSVSIIVPAYNEEVNAVKTVQNLLKQDYPNFDIIFVNDGSKDSTFAVVDEAFKNHPKVRVFDKTNGGKASALNFGIEHSTGEFVVCIDADTQLKTDAVRKMMPYFQDEKVGAVAGNVKVGNEVNMLTYWQSIEYTTSQNFDRRAFDLINAITVVPGAIGAFRKSVILSVGGFATDTLAEDCDLTIRILRGGNIVRSCTAAIAVTEAPETFQMFMRQRFRWTYGIMQSFWKNRDAFLNPRFGALGMVALPNLLIFQILMPLIAPLADFLLIIGLIWNRSSSEGLAKILGFYGFFLLVDMGVSLLGFWFEGEKKWKILWLIPQRLVYRQLMYWTLFKAIRRAVKGESQSWGVLKRTGNVKAMES